MKSISTFLKSGLYLINFLAVYRTLQIYFYDIRSAIGPSMVPTIRETGDVLIVDKFTPNFRKYKKDDVVILRSPMKLSSVLCKRVIAVAGEKRELGGQHYLVPENYIWVEGDNKNHSFDSRDFGPVPVNLVEGRVVLKLWDSLERL